MSQERDVIILTPDGATKTGTVTEAVESLTPEGKAELTREQQKAELIEILDRGWTSVRLKVDLPPNLHGEWIRKDINSVTRAQRLGFRDGSEYAKKNALHSDGTTNADIGDCMFMVVDKSRKNLIDEVKRELYNRKHRPKKAKSEAKVESEEREFRSSVEDKLGLPVIEESKKDTVSGTEIEAALKSKK